MAVQPWQRPEIIAGNQILLDSYAVLVGRELIDRSTPPAHQAELLYHAPFVVVAHGTEVDPILNYGNRVALELWELDWEQFTRTPSRCTAAPGNQANRAQLLQRVAQWGYVADYSGVRISSRGRPFTIQQATIWNLTNSQGQPWGQAATFDRWQFHDA